jgi:hypothetical protein
MRRQQAMSKKPSKKLDKSKTDIKTIWCPDKEGFRYLNVCEINCKKRDKCIAYKNYLEPKLFS